MNKYPCAEKARETAAAKGNFKQISVEYLHEITDFF